MNKKIEYGLGVALSIILPLATIFLILYLKKSNPNQTSNNIITTVSPFLMSTTTMMPVTTQILNKQISARQMSGEQMPPGQMPTFQWPPLSIEDMPTIKNTLTEIGNNQAKPEQLELLEKAVKDTIEESKTTALKIVEDAKNAPKDNNGQPILDKKIYTLYMLMLMLFMASEGKYFKNEMGPEIEKSYGKMPEK